MIFVVVAIGMENILIEIGKKTTNNCWNRKEKNEANKNEISFSFALLSMNSQIEEIVIYHDNLKE